MDRDDEFDLIDPHWWQPAVNLGQVDSLASTQSDHIDLHVLHDKAEPRIRAALAAGGHIVTDQLPPDWWMLADSEAVKSASPRSVGKATFPPS